MRPVAVIARLCVLVLAACSHGEPFTSPSTGSDRPFVHERPTRLTYNPGADRSPSWLPDESALLYSADRLDRDDDDRCLEMLWPTGGRAWRTVCARSLISRDSTNTFDEAVVSPGGEVAFVRTSRRRGAPFERYNELAVGTLDDIESAVPIRSIPFVVDSQVISVVSHMHWLEPQLLVYRAGFRIPACIGPGDPCPRAMVETGRAIVLQAPGNAPVAIPGLEYASSVAVRDSDQLLFTLIGDGRVFSYRRSNGAIVLFHDFGLGIARDVAIVGSRLVAIVGGNVSVIDPALNPPGTPRLQYDLGGSLAVYDLDTGALQVLTAPTGGYRNPALSPSGRRVVFERDNDLWLLELP